ncbi:MAG: murein biosynthesis integral membrane protein MurJ [Propionibacteriaceae bacterium]|nr:murein biosynthesis integral membrane protein MurJ [Propionibacteriaceae bacterium]
MTDTQAGGRRLINATAVMASGTMVSRILGLVRAMLIAFVLGNGTRQVEAFNYANTVPTTLYLLLAGGTLNNVLVPQIVRAVTHDEDGGKAFVDRIITGFVLALGALTIVVTVSTPLVMSMFARAWTAPDMAEWWASLLLMSYICMPQLFFYGVFFLIGQVLNARDKFGPMMWAPIANNVVSIGVFALYLVIWGNQTALTGEPFTAGQAWLLAGGSTLGIIVQTVVLVPFLKRAGFSYRPRFDLKGTGLGRTFHVAKWMVGYVALTTLVQMLVANLASGATASGATDANGAGWTVYQNAYLIWILPHSLLTVSLATAMLPSASRYAVAGDRSGVAAETNHALRLATTFLLPAGVALFVLADPITRLAFGNGTGAEDYIYIAWALMAFAIGLVPFTIQYLYLRAFFAMDNTRTPFLLQIWISGANAVAALALALPWNDPTTVAARLALAYSLSYFVGVFITHFVLRRRLPELPGLATVRHLVRLFVATLPAAALAFGITWWTEQFPSLLIRAAGLAVAGVAAVLLFFFTAKRLKIAETTALLQQLRRQKGDDGQTDAVEAIVEVEDGATADDLAAPAEQAPDPDGMGVFVPVAPAAPPASALLSLPVPPIAGTPEAEASAGGRVLGERYRLARQLAVHDRAQTWRADDLVLGRAVLVHLLDGDDPATAGVLESSREAALATDSRFLRVLDVVDAEPGAGPYLVYEYTSGQTLEKVLRSGPLTGVEAAWIVREVADGLIGLHGQGHYHRHLSPATLLITTTGNVKVLGSALTSSTETPSHLSGEAADVRALGQLLYACLVARWPGGDQYGLEAAPVVQGGWVLPSQVRGGVAPAVDQVVDRLLSAVPRGHASRLATAQDVTTQLSLVLGPMGAAHDLRARLHPDVDPDDENAPPAPVSQVVPPLPTPASASRFAVWDTAPEDEPLPGATPPAVPEAEAVPEPDAPPVEPSPVEEPVEEPAAPVQDVPPEPEAPEADAYPGEYHYTNAELYGEPDEPGDETQPFVDEALSRSDSFTPVPPPAGVRPASEDEEPKRSRALTVLLGVLALVVVVGIVAVVALNVREPATPAAPPVAAVAVAEVSTFDPKADGGDASENDKRARRAIDGDPETAWRTEKYGTATFNGRKPGVGLVLDLGETRSVVDVAVTLEHAGGAVELRVPAKPADSAPMKSVDQWQMVASAKDLPQALTLAPAEPVETRFLLVYFTELPPIDKDAYRGGFAEIAVDASP